MQIVVITVIRNSKPELRGAFNAIITDSEGDMTIGWALVIGFLIWLAYRERKFRIVFGALAALTAVLFGGYLLYAYYDGEAKQSARQKWQWEHYTGYRVTRFDNSGAFDVEHGIWTDNKTAKQCTDKGYPDYPACPPQGYVVNGVPTPTGASTGFIPSQGYIPRTVVLHGGDTIRFEDDIPGDIPLLYFDGRKMLVTCGKYNDSSNSSLSMNAAKLESSGQITCQKAK